MSKPTIRRSQTVTTFGVGSIIDLPETSAMVCGIDLWDVRGFPAIHDERLEEKLHVSHFYMPANINQSKDGVMAVRFPRYLRCRGSCKRLSKIEVWADRARSLNINRDFDKQPYCDIDRISLIPSRFVVACRKGHIDDFPFEEWVHNKNPEGSTCSSPDLKYYEGNSSAGLSGIRIECSSCGLSRNMGGSFSKDVLAEVTACRGSKPWQLKWSSTCGEPLTTIQRGSSNVHFPIIKSSILIPPYSSDALRVRICSTTNWRLFESQDGAIPVENVVALIALELQEDENSVREEISAMLDTDDNNPGDSEENYRYQEFMAFNGGISNEINNKDFLIEKISGSKYNIPILDSVTLVKRLREVRVQTGFTRIKPVGGSDYQPDEKSTLGQVEMVPVSEKRKGWLPGYEVRGEGIFFNIDIERIKEWQTLIINSPRQKGITNRSNKNPDPFGIVKELTPGFIAIHTLSHILIRQLSFECGYPTSSLRERIYYSEDKAHSMAGILVYTADGDSDGTLGGLVRQGKPDFLNDIINKAVDQAKWCSSDPLCIESEGQGFLGLSLGACHACTFLPETSCELLNRYLDRGTIVGTIDGERGLF